MLTIAGFLMPASPQRSPTCPSALGGRIIEGLDALAKCGQGAFKYAREHGALIDILSICDTRDNGARTHSAVCIACTNDTIRIAASTTS